MKLHKTREPITMLTEENSNGKQHKVNENKLY